MHIDKIQTWRVDRKRYQYHNMFTPSVACSLRTVITFPPIVFAGPVELGRWYILKSTVTENDMT